MVISGKNLLKYNLIFIFIFLNVWDFITSRELFNAMAIGLVIFGPAAFLWFIGTLRAIALLTLISIFEFVAMTVFVIEGFQLSGVVQSLKPLFWVPYLAMAGINGWWGLKIYFAQKKEKV